MRADPHALWARSSLRGMGGGEGTTPFSRSLRKPQDLPRHPFSPPHTLRIRVAKSANPPTVGMSLPAGRVTNLTSHAGVPSGPRPAWLRVKCPGPGRDLGFWGSLTRRPTVRDTEVHKSCKYKFYYDRTPTRVRVPLTRQR